MGTLGSRATSFGLADLRGGLHAGFDEGAWITTSYGIAQMLVGVASPYLGAVFGARRVLLGGIVLFFVASLLVPFSNGYATYSVMLFVAGFGMLYAGMDQGNRLDWRGSGLVVGLLTGGAILSIAFIARELTTSRPFLNLRVLLRGNLLLLLMALAGFRFIILSTAYIIPTYLQAVQNFRELQVGQVLLWIAVPQLVLALPLAALLRRIDGRLFLMAGTLLIGVACLMAARITSAWATDDFLPSQILQAVGQSFALTALVMLIVRSIVPAEALTVGCLLQVSACSGARWARHSCKRLCGCVSNRPELDDPGHRRDDQPRLM